MMWDDHGHWGSNWMVVSIMVLVTMLVASVVVLAVRLLVSSTTSSHTELPRTPDAVLAQRLAAGEIGVEQYEAAHAALHRQTP